MKAANRLEKQFRETRCKKWFELTLFTQLSIVICAGHRRRTRALWAYASTRVRVAILEEKPASRFQCAIVRYVV